ncbi:MAG: hypothetical protein ABSA30_00115 [Candidatus Aminicenantales bacterium]|jgi:hypothetical protein
MFRKVCLCLLAAAGLAAAMFAAAPADAGIFSGHQRTEAAQQVAADPPVTAAADCTARIYPDRPVVCPWNSTCRPPKEQNITINEAPPAQTVQPSPPAIAVDPPRPKFPFALLGIVVAVSLVLSGIAAFYARVRAAGPAS